MRVSILGCGRWGSFHAWHASLAGHGVTLWGRGSSRRMEELIAERKNEYLTLPESVALTTDLEAALSGAEIVIIAVASQGLRGLARRIAALPGPLWQGKPLVLCMKGLEAATGKRLSEIMREELGEGAAVAVWAGPGHVQDFLAGEPNCMVMASADEDLTRRAAAALASPLVRFYYGRDLLGTEIGAAAKNVIGLAAGMLDGLHRSSLKGALMARGASELSRLVAAMGGDRMTIYGLAHLGDYEATLFSPHSNNRRYGERLVLSARETKLAEGVFAADALSVLAERYGEELPICGTVRDIIRSGADPRDALTKLFLRPPKSE